MKLHILSAHLSMHEMTRRGGCKILVLHISFRLCNRRPVTPHPFVWPTPARCVLLDKGSAVFDERFLIVSDWSWKRGEKEKDEKRDRKKKTRTNGAAVAWMVVDNADSFSVPRVSIHELEGIQMQEVTHPVRSIYRLQDRASAFIRPVLDTRNADREL